MLVDLGFWNEKGVYVEDFQEIERKEIEMTKEELLEVIDGCISANRTVYQIREEDDYGYCSREVETLSEDGFIQLCNIIAKEC